MTFFYLRRRLSTTRSFSLRKKIKLRDWKICKARRIVNWCMRWRMWKNWIKKSKMFLTGIELWIKRGTSRKRHRKVIGNKDWVVRNEKMYFIKDIDNFKKNKVIFWHKLISMNLARDSILSYTNKTKSWKKKFKKYPKERKMFKDRILIVRKKSWKWKSKNYMRG